MTRCVRIWLAAAALAMSCATRAPAQAATPEATAKAFAEAVVAQNGAAVRAAGTPEMAAAMTDAAISQLIAGVSGQTGPITGVGEATYDDKIQGYQRYRVPVMGEKATVDFRVVLDDALHVAGLRLVPHALKSAATTTADSAGARLRAIDVNIGNGDDSLPGTLTLPDGAGPFPVVLLVHGSGPNDRDESILGNKPFRDLAYGLAAAGVATLRYDKRSFAKPQSLARHGANLTVRQEVIDDAEAAVALLRTRKEIDPARVYVLGHSLGGMLAPRIAKETRADGVIIMAGATGSLPDKMIEQTEYLAALDDTVSAEESAQIAQLKETIASLHAAQADSAQSGAWFLGAPVGYFTDLESYDGPSEAAALTIPTLVLQGARDYQVTLKDFGRWQRALADSPHACMKVYGDLDHLMRPGEGKSGPADYEMARPVAPQVIDDIAGFVREGCRTPRR